MNTETSCFTIHNHQHFGPIDYNINCNRDAWTFTIHCSWEFWMNFDSVFILLFSGVLLFSSSEWIRSRLYWLFALLKLDIDMYMYECNSQLPRLTIPKIIILKNSYTANVWTRSFVRIDFIVYGVRTYGHRTHGNTALVYCFLLADSKDEH